MTAKQRLGELIQRNLQQNRFRIALIALLMLLGLVLYKSFILSPLWLDETLTFWVCKDSLADAIFRSWNFEGQSPLYYIIVWLIMRVLPPTELVLRMPTIIAVLASCLVLFKISTRYFDRTASLLVVSCFLIAEETSRSFSAKPNGLALFFALLATELFLKYQVQSNKRNLALYFGALLSTFYFHYLFAAILIVHLALLSDRDKSSPATYRPILLALVCFALFSIPGLAQLRLLSQRQALFLADPPTLPELGAVLFPLRVVIPAIVSALFGLIIFGRRKINAVQNRPNVWPLLVWWLAPFIFFLAARFFQPYLFLERYFAWSCAGTALLVGYLLTLGLDAKQRFVVGLAFIVTAADWISVHTWDIDEWRQVSQAEQSFSRDHPEFKTQILAFTNLIEDERIDWFSDPLKRSYLLAPFSFYPVSSEPTLLPRTLESAAGQEYFKVLIEPILRQSNDFIFICRRLAEVETTQGRISVLKYYTDLFEKAGFYGQSLAATNIVRIIHFSKSAARAQ
jgi:hypothetical protein